LLNSAPAAGGTEACQPILNRPVDNRSGLS
jgi:hypothetical protein